MSRSLFALAAVAVTLAACGGGGGDATPQSVPLSVIDAQIAASEAATKKQADPVIANERTKKTADPLIANEKNKPVASSTDGKKNAEFIFTVLTISGDTCPSCGPGSSSGNWSGNTGSVSGNWGTGTTTSP